MKRVLLLLTVVFCTLGASHAQNIVIGERAPELKSVTWLASRNPAAADLSYLVFFHSSNKGCTASLDALRDLSNKLGSKLRIIIITQEDSEKIAPILTPYISERIGVALDHDKKVFGSFGVDFVPFSVLIDAKNRVMWCSVISALLNVLLDWLFIFPLGWGVMGAAFATAISVSVGGGIAVWYLLCRARSLSLCPLKGSRKSLRLSLRNVGYQCRIGSSALLGEATLATLMFTGNQVFMRYLGDDGVGAFGIACYYIPFVFMVGNAIAQSAQPIISYNFGAGASGRVIQARRIALATAVVCGMTAMGLFVCCPRILVGFFLDTDTPAALIAIEGFPLFASGFVFFIVNLTVIGYYQSLERVRAATTFALLRGFVLLVPAFLLLPRVAGISGIWLAMPLSELLTCAVIAVFYNLRRGFGLRFS